MNDSVIIERRGFPVVIAGPSGVGKGTVISHILSSDDRFVRSRSATTRKKRNGDPNESKYNFVTKEEFERDLHAGKVIEYTLYEGEYYGTVSSQIDEQLELGRSVLLDIDVKGALAIRKMYPSAVLIWLLPESFSQLERRLRDRGTESEEKIQGRLDKAREELTYFDEFDYLVVNEYGKIDKAADDVLAIVRAAAMRTKLCRGFYDKFVRGMQN